MLCGSLASCARDKAEAAVERDRTRSNRQNGDVHKTANLCKSHPNYHGIMLSVIAFRFIPVSPDMKMKTLTSTPAEECEAAAELPVDEQS